LRFLPTSDFGGEAPALVYNWAYPVCDKKDCTIQAQNKALNLFANMNDILIEAKKEVPAMANNIQTTPSENMPRICRHCGKFGKNLKRCARCHEAYFCDASCQREAWAEHKTECKPKE